MSDLTLQISVCVLLGISLLGVLAAFGSMIFEPLIMAAFYFQFGSPAGFILLWILKAVGWNVPMIPLVIGSVAVLPICVILIAEKFDLFNINGRASTIQNRDQYVQIKGAPATQLHENAYIVHGSAHLLADLPSNWIIPAVIIYNLCNTWIVGSIIIPMIWKA